MQSAVVGKKLENLGRRRKSILSRVYNVLNEAFEPLRKNALLISFASCQQHLLLFLLSIFLFLLSKETVKGAEDWFTFKLLIELRS